MNYLEQIIAFQRWKDVNPLPASAIALWYELMAICNKAGWPEDFTIPNAVLQASAGLSRKEFERARQILIDLGRIHYSKSKRVNTAGKYEIIPFSIVQKGQQNGQQVEQRDGQQEEHKRGNGRGNLYINKNLNETKTGNNITPINIPPKGERTRFVPPTLDEVRAYCEERQNGIDPEQWYDFYASKGWMVGKNKMKDWRAAVRTWERGRRTNQSPLASMPQRRKETSYEILQRMLMEGEHGQTGRIEVGHHVLS